MAFEEALRQIIDDAELDENPSFGDLRRMSLKEGKETDFGALAFTTKVRGRSAKNTEIVDGEPTAEQKKTVGKLVEYLRGRKLIMLERRMCQTKPFICRALVSADYPHIPYMWGRMLFDCAGEGKPDFNTVQVPEWPEIKIIADPKSGITFVLGSDYTGEMKKANLRMAMYRTKQAGGLGLHAGSKLMKIIDAKGRLQEKGVLLFGLSATGKTTLTCHHHWLDKEGGEGVVIRQDDVVLMQKDSSCTGTEDNFYIKTDGLEPADQPLLFNAAISRNALFENIKVLPGGGVDFFDTSLTSNGRAVVMRKEIGFTNTSIDLPRADIILFITRRNTIVPPVAKLDEVMGAAFFMLGESVGSAASDVDPGKSRRVVGTNPFIIGPPDEEGNRFHDLLKKNPHLECYLLNTGMIGDGGSGPGEKITVHDSTVIMREIVRGTVQWKKDPDWNYQVLDSCPEVDVSKFHPEKHYGRNEYLQMTEELRKERREWLAQFRNLYPKIRNAI
ncbi:MAG: phosphoenolpyruvate carboxykinase [Candidatus Micrarchaeota archaeon]